MPVSPRNKSAKPMTAAIAMAIATFLKETSERLRPGVGILPARLTQLGKGFRQVDIEFMRGGVLAGVVAARGSYGRDWQAGSDRRRQKRARDEVRGRQRNSPRNNGTHCRSWPDGGLPRISSACTGSGLPPGDTSEDRPDGHAEAGEIALAQDRARHGLTGRPEVALSDRISRAALGVLVNFQPQIGEGHAGAQRVAVKRRLGDRACPIGFRRRKAFWVATPSSSVG